MDSLYPEAEMLVRNTQTVSTKFLQDRLCCGKARSKGLLSSLSDNKVIEKRLFGYRVVAGPLDPDEQQLYDTRLEKRIGKLDDILKEKGELTPSIVQKELGIGYAQAARLIHTRTQRDTTRI